MAGDLTTAKSRSFHIICDLALINQLKSYSCVCQSVGVTGPRTALVCRCVFICTVWESIGVQVLSRNVWYLVFVLEKKGFAACTETVVLLIQTFL